ncbi:carboxymuconolactone decarboxylase family protein [Pontibacter sp. G13]|uniref:carboxymuconolactone decarboxylase family protein n=1 Tax=Pontibacter sp. G13 TaxID=3074898 RepID=UPI00288B27FE|nr:carboxymuconolactone decarboxylase family protein [Pontibacter sp. G13]WNJ16427.1 carboxymuconolactone decarboxylase family protein [Pontibacter sp. G13]
MSKVESFNDYRSRMNDRILGSESKILKRIFNLDTNTFKAGALPSKTKELAGLSASMVLRCDDCIKYHIGSAIEAGATEAELIEVFEIATLVGGTIVIPHLRRAYEYMDEVLGSSAEASEA